MTKVKYLGLYPIHHEAKGFVGHVKKNDIIEVSENVYYTNHNDWEVLSGKGKKPSAKSQGLSGKGEKPSAKSQGADKKEKEMRNSKKE